MCVHVSPYVQCMCLYVVGETNETTVTSSLMAHAEEAAHMVMNSVPDRVALDWHNISCNIYKVSCMT